MRGLCRGIIKIGSDNGIVNERMNDGSVTVTFIGIDLYVFDVRMRGSEQHEQ